jgi:sugar phosphate isomerase/epimerase
VLAALRDAGYDGWLSIEYEGTADAKQGLEQSVQATHKLVKEVAA